MTSRVTDKERRQLLMAAVAAGVRQGGRVAYLGDFHAVLITGRPVNQTLHLLLTILTVGLWVIVWIALDIFGGEKPELLVVDEQGLIHALDRHDLPAP